MRKEVLRARVTVEEGEKRLNALTLLHIFRLAFEKPEKPSDIFVIFVEQPKEVFLNVMRSWNGLTSLDKPVGEDAVDNNYENNNNQEALSGIIPSDYPGTEEMALAQVWSQEIPQKIRPMIEQWIEQSGLTEKQRQALRLYYFGGLSLKQVGKLLGHNNHQRADQLVNEGLVRIRKNPDVARLREELL